MCGITGFLDNEVKGSLAGAALQVMTNTIAHRGPDAEGFWVKDGVALGHRRLSILDLSEAGAQPMELGRYVLVFNGEIYNHLELRSELQHSWRGHSDTETILAGFNQWGVVQTLKKMVGMFAIALWDKEERKLILARDRMGEKPLYYGIQRGVLLFGSELKALKAHPSFEGKINLEALTSFLRHNYVPAPHSIYQNIFKLKPAHFIVYGEGLEVLDSGCYWNLPINAAEFKGDEKEALEELERLVKGAISSQMLSDVPLGAFLSGGVDSSTVVALMQSMIKEKVKTFTIGFHEKEYNEAEHAKAVAKHLGVDHTEVYVSAKEALDVIPLLPKIYDEPFADSSQIPTYLVSKIAKSSVTVSLSGDAGDELFGGYNRYVMSQKLWGKMSKVPAPLRGLMGSGLKSFSPEMWDKVLGPTNVMRNPGDKMHKLAAVLGAKSLSELYLGFVSHWSDPASVVKGGREASTALNGGGDFGRGIQRMMNLDMMSYLPDDILVKVDRAAMAVSLETRVPFLDYRVVEFAQSLPIDLKIRGGQGKYLLRQLLYKHVPRELIERPKMGFGIPLDQWLRGPLREWAEELLRVERLQDYFHPEPIRLKWAEHLSGKRNWQYHLWDILMFQAWREAQ